MTVPPEAVDAGYLKASMKYSSRVPEQEISVVGAGNVVVDKIGAVELSRLRLTFVDMVREAMKAVKLTAGDKAKGMEMPLPVAQSMIAKLGEEMDASIVAAQEAMQGLKEDLTGQVAEAFS